MKKSTLFALWSFLFILCAVLGFIPEPEGAVKVLLRILGIGAFVPAGYLLYQAVQAKDRKTILLIRKISILSLSLTFVFLVLNILSVLWSEALGNVLYIILVMVSSPMVCCGGYAVSIFLWACLLIASIKYGKK
jgi:hypothetical protein